MKQVKYTCVFFQPRPNLWLICRQIQFNLPICRLIFLIYQVVVKVQFFLPIWSIGLPFADIGFILCLRLEALYENEPRSIGLFARGA